MVLVLFLVFRFYEVWRTGRFEERDGRLRLKSRLKNAETASTSH